VISVFMFTFIYKFLPLVNVSLRAALTGGLVAGDLFEVAKLVFRWYATSFAVLGKVYGPLTSLVLLVLWIYYASLVTLLGAELTSVYYARITAGRSAADER